MFIINYYVNCEFFYLYVKLYSHFPILFSFSLTVCEFEGGGGMALEPSDDFFRSLTQQSDTIHTL